MRFMLYFLLCCLFCNEIKWHTGLKSGSMKSRSLRDTNWTKNPKFICSHSVLLLELNTQPGSETQQTNTNSKIKSTTYSVWIMCARENISSSPVVFLLRKGKMKNSTMFPLWNSSMRWNWISKAWRLRKNCWESSWVKHLIISGHSWSIGNVEEMVFLQLLVSLTAEVFADNALQ